jgi:2-C-methyl-D-erythritol 4-phosphate cytidylyltransferase
MFTLQAPQAFRLGPIHKAHLLGKQERIHDKVVDQAHLISLLREEKIDRTLAPLRLVEGLVGNIKITTTDDINYFEFLLKSGKYKQLTQDPKNS